MAILSNYHFSPCSHSSSTGGKEPEPYSNIQNDFYWYGETDRVISQHALVLLHYSRLPEAPKSYISSWAMLTLQDEKERRERRARGGEERKYGAVNKLIIGWSRWPSRWGRREISLSFTASHIPFIFWQRDLCACGRVLTLALWWIRSLFRAGESGCVLTCDELSPGMRTKDLSPLHTPSESLSY